MSNNNNRGDSRPGAGRKKKNPDGTFEHKTFTAEQLKTLIDSPYVSYVSSKTVSYTKAFKNLAWQRYCDGIDPIQIFTEAGLSLEILGRSRIKGFFELLRQAKGRGFEFTEGSEPYPDDNKDAPPIPTPPRRANKGRPPLMNESEINHLATKVAYMSQEIEFIKKIILAEKEGK